MRRRLHPAAIAINALAALRDGAFPLLVLIVASVALGRGLDGQALIRGGVYAAGGLVVATAVGFVRWASTTFGVDESAFRYRSGWLSVKETDVPIARVQSLDVQQGPVQRLFGVRAVSVQAAGGGRGGEIELNAVDDATVERLRELLGRRATVEVGPAPPEWALGTRRLIAGAVTAGQIAMVLPVLAVLGQVFQALPGDERSNGEALTHLLPHGAAGWILAVAVLLALAWLLSALGSIVAFAGFRLAREPSRLRIRRGLVQRREVTLPVDRVRSVTVVEGLLRQPFGLAALRVEVIGYARERAAARTLFPLLRRDEVRALLAELLPELEDDVEGLAPPPPRARRRYLLPPALAGLAAGAVGCVWLAPWPLLLAPAGLALGWLEWSGAGWRLAGGRLAVRSRALTRRTVLAPAAGRESHAVAQSVLQRHARLANLEVDFGARTTARIRHLDERVAREAWEALR
jgi:putative membrane protein